MEACCSGSSLSLISGHMQQSGLWSSFTCLGSCDTLCAPWDSSPPPQGGHSRTWKTGQLLVFSKSCQHKGKCFCAHHGNAVWFMRLKRQQSWRKIFHANRNQKKAGVAIPISDKIDFKIKTITGDKEGHYIMSKGSIQEDITIVNI